MKLSGSDRGHDRCVIHTSKASVPAVGDGRGAARGRARAWAWAWAVGLALPLWAATARGGLPEPWRFVGPLPQGNDLLAAWVAGPDQLWVGGHGGTILRWDGTRWTRESTPTQKTIFGIHGLSPTDIWAVGGDPYTDNMTNRCLILHYDGKAWTEMPGPRFSNTTYPLNAVHAVAANDVWATQDGGTFLVHYDGRVWDWVSVPLSVEGTFRAVTSAGPDHVFVAGTHGQILHRDRGVWKLERKTDTGNFTTSILNALWAFDGERAFAAGNWTQILRRDPDGTWTQLPVGPTQTFGFGFLNVWGTSPTNLYFMDVQGVFHSDGVAPATRVSYELSMRRQWLAACGAGDRMYGAGPAGVVHEFVPGSGSTPDVLSPLSVGGLAELKMIFRGATACGSGDLVLWGSSYAQPDASPLWYLKEGIPWRWPTMPPGMNANSEVKAAVATGGLEDVVVAWENLLDPGRGVNRWNGREWLPMDGAESSVAFSRSPSGRLWAVGPMRIQYWNGVGAWVDSHILPFEQADTVLSTIWARADNEVYVGARNGRILRFDGTSWKSETTPATTAVVGIAGTATDTYAVGENGAAWRRVGTAWQPLAGVAARAEEHFGPIAVGADGVYAAQRTPGNFTGGGLGRVWRFQGASATRVIEGLSQPLEALVRTGSGHLVGVAPRDFIVTTAPLPATAPELQRIDLGRTDWQPLGASGLAVAPEVPLLGRPMMAAQRVEGPVPFAALDGLPADHGEYWVLREDRFYAGLSVPALRLRAEYDPARMTPEIAGGSPVLYRVSETPTEVETTWDAGARTVASVGRVDGTVWTLARAETPPSLAAVRSDGNALVLSWPVTAAGYSLQTSAALGAEARWETVKTPTVIHGVSRTVTVNAGAGTGFFRLAR